MDTVPSLNQRYGYLKIIKILSQDEVICRCDCGKRILIEIKNLKTDGRYKISCGCKVTKKSCPALYKVWNKMTNEEQSEWGKWEDFSTWAIGLGYCSVYSSHKKSRKLPYNKENLEFGLYINSEFFSIERLKENRIVYNEEVMQFVTSQRIKNLIVDDTNITRLLTIQSVRHKTLPDKLFKLLK